MTGWIAIVISVAALVVSYLSYRRAKDADERAGAALLTGQIAQYPTIKEAWDGTTKITITNTGPSIAEDVKVTIIESEEAAEARDRERTHVSSVAARLGVDQPKEILATGAVSEPGDVVVSWRDAAGDHELTPEPPPTPPKIGSAHRRRI